MIDLKQKSGLPLSLDEQGKLKFSAPLTEVQPSIRTYEEIKNVLADKTSKPASDEIYYMYRNIHLPEHDVLIDHKRVTYDITVIPPGKIGNEFHKTIGHYHAVKPGTRFAYPEVYEVIHGHALFLLQKIDDSDRVITVIGMEAKAGDKVVYPPNYGHIIVNLGDETLVTANWVGADFERLYQPVMDKHGMAYYVEEDKEEEFGYKFTMNPSYNNHPKVRMLTNKFMHNFSIMDKGPIYTIGVNKPASLDFLIYPEKYAVELSSITS